MTSEQMAEFIEEAESAFRFEHDTYYWSDSNPRPPQGHDTEFEQCRDAECTKRREMLRLAEVANVEGKS